MAAATEESTRARIAFHQRPGYKWAVVAVLWWMCFFNYADRQAIFSLFPLLEREMHLTPVQLGWLGSSFALVYGLLAPFAGNIGDRFRRKHVIIWGLYVWSIICLFTGFSRRFWHLLLFRGAEGLGETFYFPATTSLLSDYHGKRTRSRALGIHNTGVYVGTIAGGFFAGLIGAHYGWRYSFYVFGGLGIVLGLALMWFVVEPRRGAAERAELGAAGPRRQDRQQSDSATPGGVEQEEPAGPAPGGPSPLMLVVAMMVYLGCLAAGAWVGLELGRALGLTFEVGGIPLGIVLGALPGIAVGLVAAMYVGQGARGLEFLRWVFGTPTVLVLMAVFMMANFVALILLSWMPKFLYDKFGLNLAMAGLTATIFVQTATVVGAPLGGLFADLLRRRTAGGRMMVQALALLAGAPFVFMTGMTKAIPVLIVVLIGWGLLKGMYDANIFASAFDVVPPHMRGTAAGFMNMAGWLGAFPAPVIIGIIAMRYNLSIAIASASGIYVVAGVLMLIGVAAFAKRDAARMERVLLAANDSGRAS